MWQKTPQRQNDALQFNERALNAFMYAEWSLNFIALKVRVYTEKCLIVRYEWDASTYEWNITYSWAVIWIAIQTQVSLV